MKRKVALVARYRIAYGIVTLNFIIVHYDTPPCKSLTYLSDDDAEEFIISLGLDKDSYIFREFLINDDDTACEYIFH